MSGGRFNYTDSALMNEIFGFSENPKNVFEDWEISQLVWDTLELIHDYDLYVSSDTCEETWLKAKQKFKRKWFGSSRKDRLKEIIDDTAEEFKKEMYKTIGVKVEEQWDG